MTFNKSTQKLQENADLCKGKSGTDVESVSGVSGSGIHISMTSRIQ